MNCGKAINCAGIQTVLCEIAITRLAISSGPILRHVYLIENIKRIIIVLVVVCRCSIRYFIIVIYTLNILICYFLMTDFYEQLFFV